MEIFIPGSRKAFLRDLDFLRALQFSALMGPNILTHAMRLRLASGGGEQGRECHPLGNEEKEYRDFSKSTQLAQFLKRQSRDPGEHPGKHLLTLSVPAMNS